jgi:hypothetical protein
MGQPRPLGEIILLKKHHSPCPAHTRTDQAISAVIAIKDLTAAQRHTDDRLNALISVVADIVRHRPPQ